MNVQVVVAENVRGSGVHLSFLKRNAYEQWQIAMLSVCKIYHAPCQRVTEVVKHFSEVYLEGVYAVIATHHTVLVKL